jgi:hypothetical protein
LIDRSFSSRRLVELQHLPWTTHDVLKVIRRHQGQNNGIYVSGAGSTSSASSVGIDAGHNFLSSAASSAASPCATTSSKHSNASSSSSSGASSAIATAGGVNGLPQQQATTAGVGAVSEGRVSIEAVPRLSYLLQRALVRLGREAQRLARPLGMCSKQEVAAALKIVLSPALADSCLKVSSQPV